MAAFARVEAADGPRVINPVIEEAKRVVAQAEVRLDSLNIEYLSRKVTHPFIRFLGDHDNFGLIDVTAYASLIILWGKLMT